MTRRKTPKLVKSVTKNVPEITAIATSKGKRNLVLLLSIFMLAGLATGRYALANRSCPWCAHIHSFTRNVGWDSMSCH